ncbi:anti-sigma factor family protein [Calorimonas adulescens]|jgi:hypothetical protein|uniref:Putative zinc-finger domain-containing protein n=1 Tax=Calorimonas adulescens TaxID=2606906 RepID=A0A5D8QB99_9THEO|nr:zf-HC2 domain-containing protein [Calorimonas adulescens]TZE80638.1 hypothetical protein FWJ32_12710 [Calorimonas adulescens]
MRCDEVEKLLSEYMDRVLDEETMLEIEQHIDACPDCIKIYDEMTEERRLIGLMAGIGPSAGFTEKVMNAVRENLSPYLFLPVPLLEIFALVFMGLAMGKGIYMLLSIYWTVASGVIISILRVYSSSPFAWAEMMLIFTITMTALIYLFDRFLKEARR